VRLWDASTGAIISTLTGHLFDIYDVAFSPNGHQIASGSEDNLVRLWEVDPSASNVAPPSFGSVCRITYSPDGRSILSGNSSGAVQEWDPVMGEAKPILQKCPGGFPSMAFSPDDCQFASGGRDGYIRLWDRHTGASASDVLRADDGAFRGRDKSILDMTYSPCGRWIISIALNKAVRLWDVQQGKQEQVIERPATDMDDNVRCVTFSPTGLQFAMGYLDGTVCLFDLGKRRCIKFTRTGEDPVRVLTYAPNGQELAVGTSTAICFWDFHSEEEEEREEWPCIELIKDGLPAHCLVYSPCGQWVVSSTGNVRLWYHGKESWTCVAVVRGFFYSVASVAWNPVSPLEFVTGCLGDGSVSVWRILYNGGDDGGPNKEVKSVSVSIKMVWGSGVGRLCTSGLTLEGAIGLAPIYRKLLAQRGSR
jgi:WD40 repeat protein